MVGHQNACITSKCSWGKKTIQDTAEPTLGQLATRLSTRANDGQYSAANNSNECKETGIKIIKKVLGRQLHIITGTYTIALAFQIGS